MLGLFDKKYDPDQLALFSKLRQNPLLKNLTDKELALFLPHIYEREYGMDEVVFFSGDPSQALYIIDKGKIDLNIHINEKLEKLDHLYAGDVFGDNSLIAGTKRIYTAIVTSDTAKLFVIPQINILKICQDHKDIHIKLLTQLATQYNAYTKKLFEVYKTNYGFFDLHMVYAKNQHQH